MSLRKVVKRVARAAVGYVTGGVSGAVTAAVMPGGGNGGDGGGAIPTMGTLPPLVRTLPGVVGFGAGVVARKARTIARAAAALCIKHPQWCSTIGGVAAVGAMMESGQLPIPKRRRGRGLTPRDLRSFRRVARLIRGFAPTVRRIPHKALHVRGTGITHA